jgi:hypothetical protein
MRGIESFRGLRSPETAQRVRMVRGALLENNFAVALRAVRPRQKRSREKDREKPHGLASPDIDRLFVDSAAKLMAMSFS